MATGLHSWSNIAASNSNADANVNWAEGMAPSQVNDSARAMMASAALWYGDQKGFATGGSSSAFTYTSQQGFTSLAQMDTAVMAMKFSGTNDTGATLNVDGLGAKILTYDDANPLPVGFLQAGTIYEITYSNFSGHFKVHGTSNANFLPPGVIMPYAGTAAPTGWLLCDGSAVSRTTYSNLFGAIGTAFGIGDGSTTFNLPNTADKVLAGKGSGSILSFSGTVGSTGGEASHTLTTGEMPVHNHTATDSGHTHGLSAIVDNLGPSQASHAFGTNTGNLEIVSPNTATGTANITVGNAGSGSSHNNVQPTLIVNHIIKT